MTDKIPSSPTLQIVEAELISANVLFHVCQYLLQNVPLSYLRRWAVHLRRSSMTSSADYYILLQIEQLALQIYEPSCGLKHMPGEMIPCESCAIQTLRHRIHQLIGAVNPNLEPTGTEPPQLQKEIDHEQV